MTLSEAINACHSVRKYQDQPIDAQTVQLLTAKIDETNRESGLRMQLVLNEPRAFKGIMSYGKFHGVENYVAVVGKKAKGAEERVGYYGEKPLPTTMHWPRV